MVHKFGYKILWEIPSPRSGSLKRLTDALLLVLLACILRLNAIDGYDLCHPHFKYFFPYTLPHSLSVACSLVGWLNGLLL